MEARATVEEYVCQQTEPELGAVVAAIARACAAIARKIRHAGLGDVYGAAGAVNVQGEQQQKLDVFANDTLTDALKQTPHVEAIISEEDEGPVLIYPGGSDFIVIFDPLDGSSNIDVNVNVGTIFSIVRNAGDMLAAALQPGKAQVAAGYVVYGPSTVMVLTTGHGVSAFTLDAEGGFVLTAEAVTMPEQGPYYSANEANAATWPAVYRDFLSTLQLGKLPGQAYSARYIGSLVADFHRTLLKGGVFLYPPTLKQPGGKLRLLYEARPLAMIAEQAGGAAVDGTHRILALKANGIHERTSLVVGSRVEVDALQQAVHNSLGLGAL
jgi:fructose-1,6-bisphosphatase I